MHLYSIIRVQIQRKANYKKWEFSNQMRCEMEQNLNVREVLLIRNKMKYYNLIFAVFYL